VMSALGRLQTALGGEDEENGEEDYDGRADEGEY